MSQISPLPPIETRGLQVAKKCKICRNGDKFYSGKTVTLDSRKFRTFDAFLSGLTTDLKLRNGAVRKLCTPVHGHRIKDLAEIEDGKVYVAAGTEAFDKAVVYTQIESVSPRRKNRAQSHERIIPAHHNRYLENVTSKISQIPTQGKTIDVCLNGRFTDRALKVNLLPHQQVTMRDIEKAIAERVAEHDIKLDKLCDLDGNLITRVNQIESGGLYVAKEKYHEFQRGRYNPHGVKNIMVPLSPRDRMPTRYLWQERTLPPINSHKKHSPDHSVSSYPETSRKRNQVNGVPVKPAKHTKKSTPKQADYDKDDGGVFKAKNQSRDTRGAREVRDTGDTKVDLPIDQVRAEEVKEEDSFVDETEAKVPSGVELSRQPSETSDQQDEKIRKEKQGKESSNRPKQTDHSHDKPAQNGDRSQANKADQSKLAGNKSQSKTSQNSTYKSNSKAPPEQTSKSSVKNDTKKDDPNDKDNRNFNNHDPVRSSTPKNDKRTTPSPTKNDKVPSPVDEHKAATKIQANYRGHQARKEVNDLKQKKEADIQKKTDDAQKTKQTKEENAAATKIQAGFRGHQARKEIKQKKQAAK